MSRPREVDHSQVTEALRRLRPSVIADRLGCSVDTVRRIRRQTRTNPIAPLSAAQAGTRDEWQQWKAELDLGSSVTAVARRFCVSRQAIYDGLERLARARTVGGIPKRRPWH